MILNVIDNSDGFIVKLDDKIIAFATPDGEILVSYLPNYAIARSILAPQYPTILWK